LKHPNNSNEGEKIWKIRFLPGKKKERSCSLQDDWKMEGKGREKKKPGRGKKGPLVKKKANRRGGGWAKKKDEISK